MELALEFIRQSKESLDANALACRLVREAWVHRRQADEDLARRSHHWDVGRMAMVDRNILRLAIWELAQGQVPAKVVIDEAIRLAKEFSSAQSPRFINGILDALAKEAPPAPEPGASDQEAPAEEPDEQAGPAADEE